MKPTLPWYQNQKKDATRKIQTSIPDKHRCKNPQQGNISKQDSTIHSAHYTMPINEHSTPKLTQNGLKTWM